MLPGKITKSGRPKLVPLNSAAHAVVERRRAAESVHLTHVFHFRGEPVLRMLNSEWKRARLAIGIPSLRVHDLRHTAAQRMHDEGVPGTVRVAILGHADGSMRAKYAPRPLGSSSQPQKRSPSSLPRATR